MNILLAIYCIIVCFTCIHIGVSIMMLEQPSGKVVAINLVTSALGFIYILLR